MEGAASSAEPGLDDRDMDGEVHVEGVRRQNYKLVDWREVKRALGL